jgi:hypothetical protein
MVEVIRSVATEFETEASLVRTCHGGAGRMIAAWLGRYEAHLTAESIGAALRVRSAGHVTNLIKQCDAELKTNEKLRDRIERCTNRLYDLWKTARPKL